MVTPEETAIITIIMVMVTSEEIPMTNMQFFLLIKITRKLSSVIYSSMVLFTPEATEAVPTAK